MNIINYHSLTQFKCTSTCVFCCAFAFASADDVQVHSNVIILFGGECVCVCDVLVAAVAGAGCHHTAPLASTKLWRFVRIGQFLCVNVDGLPCRHLERRAHTRERDCRENDERKK